MSIVEHALS